MGDENKNDTRHADGGLEVDEGENRREKFPIAISPQLSPPRSSLVEIFVVGLIDDVTVGRKWADRNAKGKGIRVGGEEV